MAAVQLNTRIDSKLKQQGDKVFSAHGLTPSEVVRAVWSYAAEHGDLPDFMKPDSEVQKSAQKMRQLRLIEEGAGIAARLAESYGARLAPSPIDYDEMRDAMYDEEIDRMQVDHA